MRRSATFTITKISIIWMLAGAKGSRAVAEVNTAVTPYITFRWPYAGQYARRSYRFSGYSREK